MSTEYKAALIYGYNLTVIKDNLDGAARDQLEDYGYDLVYDPYNDDFLYAGVQISNTSLGDGTEIDAIAALTVAVHKFKTIQDATPAEVLDKLNCGSISLYHICYAE